MSWLPIGTDKRSLFNRFHDDDRQICAPAEFLITSLCFSCLHMSLIHFTEWALNYVVWRIEIIACNVIPHVILSLIHNTAMIPTFSHLSRALPPLADKIIDLICRHAVGMNNLKFYLAQNHRLIEPMRHFGEMFEMAQNEGLRWRRRNLADFPGKSRRHVVDAVKGITGAEFPSNTHRIPIRIPMEFLSNFHWISIRNSMQKTRSYNQFRSLHLRRRRPIFFLK